MSFKTTGDKDTAKAGTPRKKRDRAKPTTTTTTKNGTGRKDPSYIPRAPNAFILFRSSFIRSQRVPGDVEGRNASLSKIVGLCWNALPPTERAHWEEKATLAQAEHRRRYPDWRFRP
ncbi:hypothetical protein BDV98DRAFT_509142, partial [Pterulicium gracile]